MRLGQRLQFPKWQQLQHRPLLRVSACRYTQQSAVHAQDMNEEEARELEARRQQGPPTPDFIQEMRFQELHRAAEAHITKEEWIKAEDKLSTILDMAPKEVILRGRTFVNLAFVEHNIGKRDKAEGHYAEGLAILRSTLGEDHHEVAHALLNYAEVLALGHKVSQAEDVCRQAIPLFEKLYGPEGELVGMTQSHFSIDDAQILLQMEEN